jgi:hypothetical protein
MTPTLAIQFAIVGLAINFLPAIIAAARRHRFLAIFLLNLLLAVMSLVGSAFGEDLIRQLKQPPYYSYYSYYAYHHYGLDPALLPRVYIGFVVATVLAWLALLIWACRRKQAAPEQRISTALGHDAAAIIAKAGGV